MTVVVATLGSMGDVHPFLAVARHLREVGEEVLFLSQEPHRVEVESQGLRFEPIVSSHDHHRTMRHPDLWHPIRGLGVLWRHLAVPAIGPTWDVLQRIQVSTSQPLTVFTSPLVVGARLAREVGGFQLVTGHTAPVALRSCLDPMFIGRHKVPSWMPCFARRQVWQLLDHYKLEPMARTSISTWRKRLKLGPLDQPVFGQWMHSPDKVIGMFPSNFGPMQPDWPVQVLPAGFPLYESGAVEAGHCAKLAAFLAAGNGVPLLVFYPGSIATDKAQLMFDVATCLAQDGIRSVLIGAVYENAPSVPGLCTLPRTTLPPLLRQADCFIHHGGIGALAQGLAADIQQVIVPSGYDQFDNAWRLATMQLSPVLASSSTLLDFIRRGLASERRKARRTMPYSLPGAPNVATRSITAEITRRS